MAGVAGGGSGARGKDAGKRDAEIERAVGLHVVVRRAAAAVLHGAAGERDLRVGLRVEVGAAGGVQRILRAARIGRGRGAGEGRSEEHTSELQSLMRISYAVFCLKKKKNTHTKNIND